MSLISQIGVVFAKQWIAGTSEEDAIKAAERINSKGKQAILNYLGEDFTSTDKVKESVRIYFDLLSMMKSKRIKGSISIKPSQLGLLISKESFYQNYLKIVSHAKMLGYNVWVDAEEYKNIERTHQVVLEVLKQYKNTGIGIQACLKRSKADAKRIAQKGGLVRLVKGAYSEPDGKAYLTRKEVQDNYLSIMKMLFRMRARFMAATHDDYLINSALLLQKKYNRRIMFGMLKGIRGLLAERLLKDGQDIEIYIPFGEEWIGYSIRRLKESGHAALLLRSIFQQ